MKSSSMPLYGGVAAAVLIAGVGGFGLAKLTQKAPAASAAEAPVAAEGHVDQVALKPEAITSAGILTETVAAGGLSAEILAQGSVTASPGGQAVLTARAGGAVTRIFKRLGDPVRAGEILAIVESGDAAQIAADRTTADAPKAILASCAGSRESPHGRPATSVLCSQAEALPPPSAEAAGSMLPAPRASRPTAGA